MTETSIQRHRRATSQANASFPTLEPGEIAVNTYSAQFAVGDVNPASKGKPVPFHAVRPFLSTAIYMGNDLIAYQGQVWRCKADGVTGDFNEITWEQITGVKFSQGVFFPTPVIDHNYIAQPSDWVRVNTRDHFISVTMQSQPADGSSFRITDVAGNIGSNPVYVMRNGHSINGIDDNYTQDHRDAIYLFSTGLGWTVLP